MDRPRGADTPLATSPASGVVGVPGTHPTVATGHTAGDKATTVTGMTTTDLTYPGLHSRMNHTSWKWMRLSSAAMAVLSVGGTAALTAAGEFKAALYWAAIGAVWLVIRANESGWMTGFREAESKAAERYIADTKTEATRAAEEQLAQEEAAAPKPIATVTRADRADEGFIYVIRFNTGSVKVGQTVEPQVRLNKHRRDAEVYGVTIVDYWVSPAHTNYLDNETRLIDLCRQVGVGVKKEYFHGMDFSEAVQIAGRLPYLCQATAEVTR